MIPFILAQIVTGNDNLDYLINQLLPIVGPIGITVIGLILLAGYVIKVTTDARVERNTQDTKRDASILDNSIQLTKTLENVATLGIALAEERGKVNLLTVQLDNLRDKNQREREELKASIRGLSDKLEGYELEIIELKASVNGKALEIKALTVERDDLSNQLKDRDAKVIYLEKQVSKLEEEIRGLKLKANESASQIESLGHQLANLDPVSTGETGKMKVIIDATIDRVAEVGDKKKELGKNPDE